MSQCVHSSEIPPKRCIKLFNKLKGFQQCGGTNDILGDLPQRVMMGVSVFICVGGQLLAFADGMTKNWGATAW